MDIDLQNDSKKRGRFIELLQTKLVERCQMNPSYSLRSFAKSLGVDSSSLSKILSGKRSLSPNMYLKLAGKLDLSPTEFKLYNPFNHSQSDSDRFNAIEPEVFEIIADWVHFAILELTHLDNFRPNIKWIAKKLSVQELHVKLAVGRLLKLNLLKIEESGNWIDVSDTLTTTNSPFTNSAFKKLQRGILDQAHKALNEVEFEQRDQSSMTMAVDSHQLQKAKEIIKKFRREICELMQATPKRNAVYQLSVSLFPITEKEKD